MEDIRLIQNLKDTTPPKPGIYRVIAAGPDHRFFEEKAEWNGTAWLIPAGMEGAGHAFDKDVIACRLFEGSDETRSISPEVDMLRESLSDLNDMLDSAVRKVLYDWSVKYGTTRTPAGSIVITPETDCQSVKIRISTEYAHTRES